MLASNFSLLAAISFFSYASANGELATLDEVQVACLEGCKPVSTTWVLENDKLVDKDFKCLEECFPNQQPRSFQRDSTGTAIAKCKIMGNGFECFQTAFQLYYMVNPKTFKQSAADKSMIEYQRRIYESRIGDKAEETKNTGQTEEKTTDSLDVEVAQAEDAASELKEKETTAESEGQSYGTGTRPFALVAVVASSFITPYICGQL